MFLRKFSRFLAHNFDQGAKGVGIFFLVFRQGEQTVNKSLSGGGNTFSSTRGGEFSPFPPCRSMVRSMYVCTRVRTDSAYTNGFRLLFIRAATRQSLFLGLRSCGSKHYCCQIVGERPNISPDCSSTVCVKMFMLDRRGGGRSIAIGMKQIIPLLVYEDPRAFWCIKYACAKIRSCDLKQYLHWGEQ